MIYIQTLKSNILIVNCQINTQFVTIALIYCTEAKLSFSSRHITHTYSCLIVYILSLNRIVHIRRISRYYSSFKLTLVSVMHLSCRLLGYLIRLLIKADSPLQEQLEPCKPL